MCPNDKIETMRPLNTAVPGALAALLRAAPMSKGKAEFAWRAAVGPAIERVTTIRLEGSILIVEASDRHWARELTRSSSMILARLQNLLGREAVTAIEVRTVDR